MWPSFQGGILGDGVARRVGKSYKGYMKCHKSVKIHFKYYYGIQADDTSYFVFKPNTVVVKWYIGFVEICVAVAVFYLL